MKNVGSVIYKEFDSVCKERLGKSFGEVMSMVPEVGLTKKVSHSQSSYMHVFTWWSVSQLCWTTFIPGFIPCCLYWFSTTLDQIPVLLDVNSIFSAVDPTSARKQCLLKNIAADIHLPLLKSVNALWSKLRTRHTLTAAIFFKVLKLCWGSRTKIKPRP